MAESPTYKALHLSVRPTRVATFIPGREYWMHFARQMIGAYSEIWGGAGDILIPCNETGGLAEPFWRVLEVFDPDILAGYMVTNRDVKLADSSRFQQIFDQEAAAWAAHAGKAVEVARREMEQDRFVERRELGWPLGKEAAQELTRRLLPPRPAAEADSNPYAGLQQFDAFDRTPDGLLNMRVLDNAEAKPRSVVETAIDDPRLHLALAARMGCLSEAYEDYLSKTTVSPGRCSCSQADLPAMLERAWCSPYLYSHESLHPAPGQNLLPHSLPGTQMTFPDQTPFATTMVGCSWRAPLSFGLRTQYVVVIGDTAEDFCFALAMDRLYGRGTWLPRGWLSGHDSSREVAVNALLARIEDTLRSPNADVTVALTSFSEPLASLAEIAAEWKPKLHVGRHTHRDPIVVLEPRQVELPIPARIVDADTYHASRYEAFYGGNCAVRIDTPVPSKLIASSAIGVQWHVDVSVEDYRAPIRPALSSLLSQDPNDYDVAGLRPSSGGISYRGSKEGLVYSTWRLQELAARPRLHLPSAKEIFDTLLKNTGLHADYSSAGRYTMGMLELWDGLDNLAADLMNPNVTKVLEAYLRPDPAKKQRNKGTAPDSDNGIKSGVYLRTDRRWYLSIRDIRGITGLTSGWACELVDSLVARRILARGLCLLCPTCSHTGWYPSEDVGQTFKCARCRKESLIKRSAWKKPAWGPWWYHELSEIVYQALDNDARVPILALAKLKDRSRAFDFVPEMVVSEQGAAKESFEVDIWAIRDGQIVIGEAKCSDNLGKKPKDVVAKVKCAAEAATADEVVFATTQPRWTDSTKTAVSKAFASSAFRVRYLEGLGTPEVRFPSEAEKTVCSVERASKRRRR